MATIAARKPPNLARWGMSLFIVTEAALFAMVFYAYYYLRSGASEWPPAGEEAPALPLAIVNTVILLASSGAIVLSERMAEHRERLARIALGVTILLGLAFLAIQGVEYAREPLRPSQSAFASLFFIVTGFHMAHVIVGVLMLAFTLALISRRGVTGERIGTVAMYWHFVDIVWLLVLFTVYLSPRVLGTP
jgi:heme/copper-type cytochrome/quinol oxidase subunit 3